MRNFQGIVSMWTQTYKEIFKFASVYLWGKWTKFRKKECQKGGIKNNGGLDPCAHYGAVKINKGDGSQNKWGRGSDKSQKNNRGKGEERVVRILESWWTESQTNLLKQIVLEDNSNFIENILYHTNHNSCNTHLVINSHSKLLANYVNVYFIPHLLHTTFWTALTKIFCDYLKFRGIHKQRRSK